MTPTEIMELLGALYLVINFVVALTPTPKDDAWLKKAMDFISILTSKDGKGTLKLPFTLSK